MTLTIQDLGALGELLGSIAVLATLVYLAMQTRQNTVAIGAQLDAARISSQLNLNLTAAASSELQEALNEDRSDAVSINQARRANYWTALTIVIQWQLHQGRRGLLPSFNEAGMKLTIRGFFSSSKSFGRWWEAVKSGYLPEFVEWVEEQRSKAA